MELTSKPMLAVDCRNTLGEGVVWSEARNSVFWTDIEGRQLWEYSPQSGVSKSRAMPSRLCAFMFRDKNTLLAAFDKYVALYSLNDSKVTHLFDFEPDNPHSRMNDGKCDPYGNFIVGGINESDDDAFRSSVIKIDPDFNITTLLTNVTCSNSICFSPDGKTMYFADTPEKQILAYPYSSDSTQLSNPRCVYHGEGDLSFPDGATVDEQGFLWCAMWGGGSVIRIDPISGQIDTRIDLPVKNPTCVAFGGVTMNTLFITSSTLQMSDEEQLAMPYSGGLFLVDVGPLG
ncbi:SMP-30/gluconolactonase/LRE family protein [Vibrio sp. RC27]